MPKETSTTAHPEIDDDTYEDDPEQSSDSTDARWYAYKRACSAAGTQPMDWGAWLRAGQPVPA